MSKKDLDFCQKLADLADEISMARFGALDLVIETKPDLTPVSDADKKVEEELRKLILEYSPSDSIIGEEFGVDGQSNREWILDPIDGTKNFVRGVPFWGTLIGLRVDNKMQVGMVSAPALGRRWFGAIGYGSYLRTNTNNFKNPKLKIVDYLFLFLIYPLFLGILIFILNFWFQEELNLIYQ